MTIRQLVRARRSKIVNAWRLERAWPSRWSGPAFDAMSNDIAYEELEIAFDDLVWLDAPPHQSQDEEAEMAVLRDRPYAQFNFLVDLGTGETDGPRGRLPGVQRDLA